MITNNMPKEKLAIVAVSRDCFPMSLSERRRKAVVEAYQASYGEIYECPVCIENELHMRAALADVNVTRFAYYLRNIRKRSQIAVITHRRGTMEEADRLYGVTMQEKGVSKLLQLNIDEIEQKILKSEKE